MKKYFKFVLMFVFFSCSNSVEKPSDQHISPEYVILVTQLRSQVASKLSKELQMTPIGEGGSFYDCVREIFLAFEILGPLTKDQLRSVLVQSVEELCSAVNSNEQLRPHLIHYPFTANEIEITLYVKNKSGEMLYDPNIDVASAIGGRLVYKSTDKDDSFRHRTIDSESY